MSIANWMERTQVLLGDKKLLRLVQSHVLVVGLGGVGAYAAEQIVRAGVGEMTIVDGDVVQPSNRNRQLPALVSTLRQSKAEVMAKRLLDINPDLKLHVVGSFLKDEAIPQLLSNRFDYVVDAIDTLSPKVYLIMTALEKGYRLVSSMGAGGKLDPSKIAVADISKSYNCNLARMIRKRLSKFGIKKGFDVVFSTELVPREVIIETEGEQNKKSTVGTMSYLPAVFGCFLASVVIRNLINDGGDAGYSVD
jgi:tRNA threonylcarbamoyladenosine dehydratase